MKISISDYRWIEYNSSPNSQSYKGYKLKDTIKTKPGVAKMSFTNGVDEFEAMGDSIEDAFVKAFDHIDLITQ